MTPGGDKLKYGADTVFVMRSIKNPAPQSVQLRVIKNRTSSNPRLTVTFQKPQFAYAKNNSFTMWPTRFLPGSLITSKKDWMLSGGAKDDLQLLGANLGELGFIVAVNGDGDANVWFPLIGRLVWIALIKHVKLIATSSEKKTHTDL